MHFAEYANATTVALCTLVLHYNTGLEQVGETMYIHAIRLTAPIILICWRSYRVLAETGKNTQLLNGYAMIPFYVWIVKNASTVQTP